MGRARSSPSRRYSSSASTPLTASVSNNMGLVSVRSSGSWGYRHELAGRPHDAAAAARVLHRRSSSGAVLLRVLPPCAFAAIVPALIAMGVVLVLLGPPIQHRASERRGADEGSTAGAGRRSCSSLGLRLGDYGSYFG